MEPTTSEVKPNLVPSRSPESLRMNPNRRLAVCVYERGISTHVKSSYASVKWIDLHGGRSPFMRGRAGNEDARSRMEIAFRRSL